MANQPFQSSQADIVEDGHDAVRKSEKTFTNTAWKIVATVVAILFVLMLVWIGTLLALHGG